MNFKENEAYCYINMSALGKAFSKLNAPELQVMGFVLNNASPDDNVISATLEDISKSTGVSLATVNRQMDKLKEANFCKRLSVGKYMLNPEVSYCDKDEDKNESKLKKLTELYEKPTISDTKYILSVSITEKYCSDIKRTIPVYGFKVKDIKEAQNNEEVCETIINIIGSGYEHQLSKIEFSDDINENSFVYFGNYEIPENDENYVPDRTSWASCVFYPSGITDKIIWTCSDKHKNFACKNCSEFSFRKHWFKLPGFKKDWVISE